MSKKAKKTLSDRLAELTSAAPIASFNPDAPDFDDGTGAGLARYDDDEDYDEGTDSSMKGHRPSAGLRVAADMESIGQEYDGKRVSRKNLQATVVGDAHDPDQDSEGSGSSGGRESDDERDNFGDDGEGDMSSSKKIVTSFNLDDVSSSDEGEEGDGDREGESDDDGDDIPTKKAKGEEKGGAGKRVHWGEEASDEDEEEYHEGGGSKRRKHVQANVFAGVKGEGADADASLEEKMKQIDQQDEKARRAGRGVAGQGELRRAREALRQREWWDGLLEVRILLQRLMNAANKLPGPNELPLFLEGDEELTALARESAGTAEGLATQLSGVRRSQMSCWGMGDDKHVVENGIASDDKSANGESESDAAATSVITQNVEEGREGSGESGGEAVAARDHRSCMGWWAGVLGRWHERTQLVDPSLQKKFRVVNQGPWAQITASLADRERANRRAFMTESETAEFLGRKVAKKLEATKSGTGAAAAPAEAESGDEGEGVEEVLGRERRKDGADPLDLEVIDDRDLYQHLLKEFMDASGAAGGGYAAVPVRRKSRKKSVDRKASKGRKIKYVTHPKMQNFMFPQEYESPPMEPSELFSSLFGGAGTTQ
ncbi:unnamed protein product [Hapterophycus canaliculatus]